MPSNRLLFLIGYRGTGKTTVAKLLAQQLGWSWLDMDDIIEARAGCPIREIFEREAEAGFRTRESAVVEELCRLQDHVIATGGGVVLDPANRELLKRAGRIVCLTADADTIHQRMHQDSCSASRRPPLTVSGGLDEVRQLLAQREPHYRACADLTVDTTGRTPDDVATYIIKWLGKFA
jgi:shikimate kinase